MSEPATKAGRAAEKMLADLEKGWLQADEYEEIAARLWMVMDEARAAGRAEALRERETLREALETIRETCKPLSMTMQGPVWFDGGTPAGGGSRERIWRICDAALTTAETDDSP